jgi:ABC-type multidrug transport system ATPase subunit
LIRQLADQGRTILMSSHAIEAVEQLCTDVVILCEGRVVAHDRVDRLRELQANASLEHVFVRLAIHQDVNAAARAFVEAVES